MRVLATIEARMSANRLPGKVLLPLCGQEVLAHVYQRVKGSQLVDGIRVATTVAPQDKAIADFCAAQSFPCYRGSEQNILERLCEASAMDTPKWIVQITADNPFVDGHLIDDVVQALIESDCDYVGNHQSHLPLGFEVRAFKRQALERVKELTTSPIDLVHGSYYLYTHPETFDVRWVTAKFDESDCHYRLTLDEPDDYQLIKTLYEHFGGNHLTMTPRAVLNFLRDNPQLASINQTVHQKVASDG